jgi:AMMECR1 domain-containing protein
VKRRYEIRKIRFAAICLVVSTTHLIADPPGPPAPSITDAQKEFLSRTVRRTMRDTVLGRGMYEPEYVPKQLEAMEAEVIVRLRLRGRLAASGAAGPLPMARAARDAALTAAHWLKADQPVTTSELGDALIEIEVVGPSEEFSTPQQWLEPRALDESIEPGVHGLTIQSKTKTTRICPTEFLTNDRIVSDALADVAPLLHDAGTNTSDVRLFRFRTVHWYEPSSGAPIISLHRGMTPVSPEEVTADRLDAAIERLAEYMIYRQQPGGLFSYQYEPALDRYSNDDNLVRQAGAAAAMALHAKWSGRSASEAAARLAIERHLKGLSDVPGQKDAAFIATPDGLNKLGVTALLAIAMAEHPRPERFAETRGKLINGMLWLQRPSGMFVTAFPPAADLESQDYFPGEALLAMALHYEQEPSARVLDAFDLSIRFYREYFESDPSPAFVPWQTQAYAIMAKQTRRADYADFTFALTDWLASMQLNSSNCVWPELRGGVASYQAGRVGVSTAAYLEGFADALLLARSRGDAARVPRYERVVRDATRFVMQLQVRPEEAYFVRTPQDTVWGIRTAPALYRLRIDHCQHALVGLMKARRALYPESG